MLCFFLKSKLQFIHISMKLTTLHPILKLLIYYTPSAYVNLAQCWTLLLNDITYLLVVMLNDNYNISFYTLSFFNYYTFYSLLGLVNRVLSGLTGL
ncbi:hypothetical protein HanRHA438_Chr09g0422551 [Helianthus annuus]|nr:hypothetical protein HanRHA438_Chr09g0422551 [Helianthus annuus]